MTLVTMTTALSTADVLSTPCTVQGEPTEPGGHAECKFNKPFNHRGDHWLPQVLLFLFNLHHAMVLGPFCLFYCRHPKKGQTTKWASCCCNRGAEPLQLSNAYRSSAWHCSSSAFVRSEHALCH